MNVVEINVISETHNHRSGPTATDQPGPIAVAAQQYIDEGAFSSVEWAVQKKRHVLSRGRLGLAERDHTQALPQNAIYRIYSMTKPVVSVAALMLIERQKLRLYDPVTRYLPAFGHQKILQSGGSLQHNPVATTIEHLLTHRSGLSYDFHADCPVATLYRQMQLADDGKRSLEDLVACLAQLPAATIPGTRWHYSYSTDVLAHIMEIVSGQTIADLLHTLITDPLEMHDTGYHVRSSGQHRLMPMYGSRTLGDVMPSDAGPQCLTPLDVEASYPSDQGTGFRRGGIGLFSTVDDYLKFTEFLRTGCTADGRALLSQSMFDMLWANRIPARQLPLTIGLNRFPGYGWNLAGRVMLDIGKALIVTSKGEGGWAGAASTYFWVDRARSLSGVVMTQYLGSALTLGPDLHSAASIEFS